MVESKIYGIATKNGWNVFVSIKNGIRCYDFHRKTLSGVPFSFTAEVKDDKICSLTNEVVSFVDAINPATCAKEWSDKIRGDGLVLVSASCSGYGRYKKQGVAVGLRLVRVVG